MRIATKALRIAPFILGLAACTTTYGPDDPPEEEVISEAPCEIDDSRPGCRAESSMCQDTHDYLCDPL